MSTNKHVDPPQQNQKQIQASLSPHLNIETSHSLNFRHHPDQKRVICTKAS